MSEDEQGDGDCFIVALRLTVELARAGELRDIKLVHGLVSRPADGLRHPHAWVEATERIAIPSGGALPYVADSRVAIDRSNGHDIVLPVAVYRRIGRVGDTAEYDPVEAVEHAIGSAHYGPWDEALRHGGNTPGAGCGAAGA